MINAMMLSLFFLCTTICKAQSPTAAGFKKLYWLVGEWKQTDAKQGSSGIEKGVMNSPVELQGSSISMRGSDTTFTEKLKIIVKDNHIYYASDIPENKGVVLFKFTMITSNEFVCENPEHDFPKKITYTINGTKLKATVSGDGKAMDYLFEKKL